ncbi:hypothetical protein [Actinotalea sp. K2]|uniref:hypothetical protein n=1 Tax=Actinotalea sp. K2 TaxID=2939438 RepID=UPI0020182CC6|nr:hypothetical protein [Actinotalea sp. K2]MCL3861780.1 hypothetical protein [Actinotalea sp. K2]
MTRPVGPLWRAAPVRLLHERGWLLLVVLTSAVLALAAVSLPLFERSVAAASVQAEIDAIPPDAFDRDAARLRTVVPAVVPPAADGPLRALLADLPELGEPVVSAFGFVERVDPRATALVGVGEVQVRGTLHYRDGAVEALAQAAGSVPDQGVWLPEEVAADLGARPGDRVELTVDLRRPAERDALDPEPVATAVLAGTYPTLEGSVLPALGELTTWVSSERDLPAMLLGERSAMVFADRATFDRLAVEIWETPLWVGDLALVDGPTPAQARSAAAGIHELGRQAFVAGSAVDRLTALGLPAPEPMQVVSGIRGVVERADATTLLARGQVRSLSWAGLALGLAAVASAAVLVQRSRRPENALAAGLGLRPWAVAALAGLEAVLPVAVGTALGAGSAWVLVRYLGPSPHLGEGILTGVVRTALLAGVLGILTMTAAAGATAAVADRWQSARLGARRRTVPWEALLVVLTLVAAAGISGTGTSRSPGALAVAFPMLLAAAVAAVGVGLLRVVQARVPWGLARVGTPRWLASHRARRTGREVTASVVIVSVGMAMLLWAIAAERGVDRGIQDKLAVAAGAPVTADVDGSWRLAPPVDDGVPTPPVPGSTFVWRQQVTLPPRFGDVTLLAVDSPRFADVALWGESGALDGGREALAMLDDGSGETPDDGSGEMPAQLAPLPVIMVDNPAYEVGDTGTLTTQAVWELRFEVVASVEAFPGMPGRGLVADATRVFTDVPFADPTLVPESSDPGLRAGGFRAAVWSGGGAVELEQMFTDAELAPPDVLTREVAAQRPGVRGALWPLEYLVALGAAATVLGVAVLLLHAVRVAERDRLGDLLLTRIGVTGRELTRARAGEMAGLLVRAAVAALVSVLVLSVAGPSLVDPVPSLVPTVRPILAWADVGLLALVVLAAGMLSTVVARRSSRAVSAGEVLRGDG